SFLSSPSRPHRHLHSFPTRRSSDLALHPAAAGEDLRHRAVEADLRPVGPRRGRERLRDAAHPTADVTPHPPHAVTLAVGWAASRDRKSTRLNSSHVAISYAVFCLKK